MTREMEIDSWKGDWGLASIDLDCLRLVTYCKFAGVPIKINLKNHTLNTPNGRMPVFRHYKHTLCSFEEVHNHLTAKNLGLDAGLSEKQKGDAVAFTMFLKEHLYPAILYVWWVDDRNRLNLTHKWFAKTMPFPLNLIYPHRYHKSAEDKVNALFPHIEDEDVLQNELYERATRCISAMSHRLGTKEFMFGSNPTSIDATLFAYLAPLVKVPFPNSKLKNYVIAQNNLLKYVTRISQRYFAAETQEYEGRRLQDHVGDVGNPINNYPHKRRDQILFGSFAFLVMAAYAVWTGLIPPHWFNRRSITLIPITYD